MSDLYKEHLVKKEKTAKDSITKYGLIGLTALLAAAGLFIHPIILIGAIAAGVATYFIIPKTDLEYEYLLVNTELDIDVIMSKTKRKRLKSFNLAEADLVAPLKSHRMDYYNSNQKMKVLDYSSGNPEHNRVAIITRDGSESCKVIIEPDDVMANAMKNAAPGKVFLDA